jgi:hypothetical protein
MTVVQRLGLWPSGSACPAQPHNRADSQNTTHSPYRYGCHTTGKVPGLNGPTAVSRGTKKPALMRERADLTFVSFAAWLRTLLYQASH